MMTKEEHVTYWIETADDNWRSIQNMYDAGEYLPALFWAHLTIEKLSKALWVRDNLDNIPPRIHNIIRLWAATTFEPTPEQEQLAYRLNDFQLEGRYPDYSHRLRRLTTAVYTRELLDAVADLRQCLRNKLLSI